MVDPKLSFKRTFSVPALSALCMFASLTAACLPGNDGWAAEDPVAGMVNTWMRHKSPAADRWDIGGQFRFRFETKSSGNYANRDFSKALGSGNSYFLLRTKLHLGWAPAPWTSIYIEGRDAHAVREIRAIPETDTFDLHQAYVRLSAPTSFPLTFKIGRQELIYGDQRFSGNSDWSNMARSFDAAKLGYGGKSFQVDVFLGRPVLPRDGAFNSALNKNWFSGVYASTERFLPWQDTELFFLANNVGKGTLAPLLQPSYDIYTVGMRIQSHPNALRAWDYSFEIADQFGSIWEEGSRKPHGGNAVNISIGRTWKHSFGSPRLEMGYDFGSGDHSTEDNRHGTLQLLFGTNHRFYGDMDLAGLRNMHIPRLETSFKPSEKVSITAEWLGFLLADTADFFYPESGAGRRLNGYGRNPAFSSYIGQEIDFLVNWRTSPWSRAQAGYGHFFAGNYIRRSLNSAPVNGGTVGANWAYLQFSCDF